MKASLCILLLAATLQGAVLQAPELECPEPTPPECADSSVCDDSSCPRYTSVKCCREFVDGECKAQFFRLPEMEIVTDRCMQGIDSCATKECPERSTCIEEELKDCPENRPNCGVRRVIASCILMETGRIPSSCDDIVCRRESTCVVSQTRRGTEAECKEIVPKSCDDVTCDEGMMCVERKKPRCVPVRTDERPTDCSQLECPKDLVCMVLDGGRGARCAKPPRPTSCDELACTSGLTCRMVGGDGQVKCVEGELAPSESVGRPRPPLVLVARECDEIDCEEGYECKVVTDRRIRGNRRPVATCVPAECPLRRRARPPVRCEEIECGRDEVCVMCRGLKTRARCIPRDPKNRINGRANMTRPDTGNDQSRSENSNMDKENKDMRANDKVRGMRRPPMFCKELICESVERKSCQEFRFEDGRPRRALCIPETAPVSCEDVECVEGTERCEELENSKVKVAYCLPTETKSLPRNDNETEIPPTQSDGLRRPSSMPSQPTRSTTSGSDSQPRPAERCEELDCGRGFECLQVMRNGSRRALCMRSREDEVCRRLPDGDRERLTSRPDDRRRPISTEDEDETNDIDDDDDGTNLKRRDGEGDRRRDEGNERRQLSSTSLDRRLPDVCMERRCCKGETCFVRRIADGGRQLAFCAPEDFDGDRPPLPRPLTCEELMCEEGFECMQKRGEGARLKGAVCMRGRLDSASPNRLKPSRPIVRPMSTAGPKATNRPEPGMSVGRPNRRV